MVVLSGSALALGTAQEGAAAVLQAWYPGAQGGRAVARALFGECNPQGKLPVTFYHSDEDLPAFTDYAMKGRTYRYMEKEPLYPFGYGLSYSHFTFRDAKADASQIGPDGVDVRVTVVNDGQYRGRETVEVYVKAERPGTPNAQLKALAKWTLCPGKKSALRCICRSVLLLFATRRAFRKCYRVNTPFGWEEASPMHAASC